MTDRKITPEQDDRLYQGAMFGEALRGNYLGNPGVVGGLVAQYCEHVRHMLVQRSDGSMTSDEFVASVSEMAIQMSVIFSGNDPEFKPIIGWNAISLRARLTEALGEYWASNRAKYGDDPVCVLFAWLCWATFDAVSRSHGDLDLEGLILADHTGSAIRLLLGTDQRAV